MRESFDEWFEDIQKHVREAGYSFHCKDSVEDDYRNGKSSKDVAAEIIADYDS